MEVKLAGFNLDAEIIKEFPSPPHQTSLTPETISAAYARISRDPRPIPELRRVARIDVEKARQSNRKIVFGLGHGSVAEHAVFNLDILGISRLAVEALEHFRLASFTEKSQRYISLEEDFIVPDEIKTAKNENIFIETLREQNQLYTELLKETSPEDARYALSLATTAQLGMTANARTLEYMIVNLAAHPLAEMRELGKKIYDTVYPIAPSLIKYTEPTKFYLNTRRELKEYCESLLPKKSRRSGKSEVQLVNYTPRPDTLVIAALIHSSTARPMKECRILAAKLKPREKRTLFNTSFKYMKSYHNVLREFENATFLFEIILSASAFAQLKRHRMATLIVQDYNPRLGVTVPPLVNNAKLKAKFQKIIQKSNAVYEEVRKKSPPAANYILTNAHRRRVLFNINARELYHFSRLREDEHAQWDIRQIAHQVSAAVRKVMPLGSQLLGGKDQFPPAARGEPRLRREADR